MTTATRRGRLASVSLPPPSTRPVLPAAVETASDYIRTLIFSGVLRAGERIPVDEIAEVLGVSRQPIREAIITMVDDGLVEVSAKRGTWVGHFSRDTVIEHFELYGLLASRSVARLAETRDESLVVRLKELDREASTVSSVAELASVLTELQRLLLFQAATPRLAALLRSLQRFVPGQFYLASVEQGVQAARRSRRKLVAAIDEQLPEAAAAAVTEQLRTGGRLLTEELERRGVFADA